MEITHLEDGAAAIEYIDANRATPASLRCDVVLLDLNLPRVEGYEVLRYIRGCEALRGLPVVIMSGSTNVDEIDGCYQAGANSFICKPIYLDDILSTAASFVSYWSHCVRLPSKRRMSGGSFAAAGR